MPTDPYLSYRLKETLTCYALLATSIGLLVVFVYIPVFWAFTRSLYDFEIGGVSRFVGIQNFSEFLTRDPVMLPSLFNMVLLMLFSVAMRLTWPLVLAKLIHSLPSERWRYVYRVVFLLPALVPGVAVQLIWGSLIYGDDGLLNEVLSSVGLGGLTHAWLADPNTALLAMAMLGFPFAGGFEVLVYYAGLSNISDSINEAAKLEGCVGLGKFLRIDVPMVLSQLKLISVLTLIAAVQGFEGVLILTRGGPGFETMVPGLWMYFNAFSFQRMGYACAIGVCLFAMIFVLTLLNMRFFKTTEQLEARR